MTNHSDNPDLNDPTGESRKPSTTPQENKPVGPPPSNLPVDDQQLDGQSSDHQDERHLGAKMTFLEHLEELRNRLIHCLASVGITFCACWIFREEIFAFLAVPIADVVGGVKQLIFIKPTEPFSIWLKVSFVAAVFLSSPYILLQVWLFIAPGLYRREKSYAIPFLVSSTVLFILGGMFAYYIILPTALDFLINQFGAPFSAMVSAIEYFNFEVVILVGMGLIFQMPVLVAFLSLFGLITPRFLWKNFRYASLAIVVIAAVVSPTADILNLFLWSGPMIILYISSIGISWIFKRRREKQLQ